MRDKLWDHIELLTAGQEKHHHNRLFAHAVLFPLLTSLRWRHLLPRSGKENAIYQHFSTAGAGKARQVKQ